MNTVVAIAGAAGTARSTIGYTTTKARWEVQVGSVTPETGGDLGSDLVIIPYSDAGIAKAPVFTIQRSSGTATFADQPNIPGYATTAYVDNSVNNAITVAEAHAIPVGSVTMFAGAAAPTGWLICNGASLNITTYATLFAILGYTYGGSGSNFNIPNMQGMFPIGAGSGYNLGSVGGAATVTLDTTTMPYHVHVVEQTPHVHGVSDPTHAHGVADPTHTHSGGIGSHTHQTASDPSIFGAVQSVSAPGIGTGAAGPTYEPLNAYNTGAGSGAITINAAATNVSIYATGTGVTVAGAYANINNNQTDATGGNLPHENRPPYLTMNFIIKYQ